MESDLNHFFISKESIKKEVVHFPPDINHQIVKVLRLQQGDEVVVLDNLSMGKEEAFPPIGGAVTRDPFAAASRWRDPRPEKLPPPPLEDLLRLQPTPLLLRSDALPRLGAVPQVDEKKIDRDVLTKLRRALKGGETESLR